jgi:hypothetical protein
MDENVNELYKLGFTCESPVSYILKVNNERIMFIETNNRFNSLWIKISQGQYRMIKKENTLENLLPYIKKEIRVLKIRNLDYF